MNKYDTIAKVGATGDVTGNHLHICVIINGIYVNPKDYLKLIQADILRFSRILDFLSFLLYSLARRLRYLLL